MERRGQDLDRKAGDVERELEMKRQESELRMREEELERRTYDAEHGDGGGPILAIILILCAILWIWALGDCLTRPDDTFPARGANDKISWTLVVLFTFVIGALLYVFRVRRHVVERPAETEA